MKICTKVKMRGTDEYKELEVRNLWIGSGWTYDLEGNLNPKQISLTVPFYDEEKAESKVFTRFLMTEDECAQLIKKLQGALDSKPSKR